MISLQLSVVDRDHLVKVMNLISNYNKLNEDKIEVDSIVEVTVGEEVDSDN